MATILLQAHSGWRYIVILVAVLAVLKLLIGLVSRGTWGTWDQRLISALTIVVDIQFLLGLVLWITKKQWLVAVPKLTWEHPFTMLLAIAAVHITATRVKRTTESSSKFRTALIGYLIAGILLAIGVARVTGWL